MSDLATRRPFLYEILVYCKPAFWGWYLITALLCFIVVSIVFMVRPDMTVGAYQAISTGIGLVYCVASCGHAIAISRF